MPIDHGRVLLLGAGMQGKAALLDLVGQPGMAHIAVVDTDPALYEWLGRHPDGRVQLHAVDATNQSGLARLMSDTDVVVEALPGAFAPMVARVAVDVGVPLVSSMYLVPPGEEDPARLETARAAVRQIDAMARKKRLPILSEFGLDPGLDLVLGAKALGELEVVEEFRAYGAGIPAPAARSNPLQYKFSWSPVGVMRSYHRPASVIRDGQVITIPPEQIFESRHGHVLDVPALGSPLECYPNGDSAHYAELFGIRDTVRMMGRYTGRLPGHCAFWDTMVKCGFLDEGAAAMGASAVPPMEFTAALLASQRQFQYADDEADMTFVRVDVRGTRGGKRVRVVYDLIDQRDFTTGLTSMQRTVGYTLSLGAQLILTGALRKTGVLTPLDVPYDLVFPALERHGIRVQRHVPCPGVKDLASRAHVGTLRDPERTAERSVIRTDRLTFSSSERIA